MAMDWERSLVRLGLGEGEGDGVGVGTVPGHSVDS